MYRQLNEEMERTPLPIKVLLCLGSVSTCILVIVFVTTLVYLSDVNTLIRDGAQTIRDLNIILPDVQEIIPQVKSSVTLLEKICSKNKNLC